MENKKAGNGFRLKDNPELIRRFMFILCVIFVVLLIYIVGALILTRGQFMANRIDTSDSDKLFPECTMLNRDCTADSCAQYTMCLAGGNKACRIYDCQDEYGVFTRDMNGEVGTHRESKPDMAEVAKAVEDCDGVMREIGGTCLDGKNYQEVLKIETAGKCEMESFAIIFKGDAGATATGFEQVEENTYQLTADKCGEIESIIAGAKGGVVLSGLEKGN